MTDQNNEAGELDDIKWDPLGDYARIRDALDGKTVYAGGRGPINPFEIEPPSSDTQNHITLGGPSRSRTWEKVSEIKRWFAAYEKNPDTAPKGYETDIDGEVVRIHFDRIEDDEALLEILVSISGSDFDRLLDQPEVELVEGTDQ